MSIVLSQNAYGKSSVRLTKVTRQADRHELAQWAIDIHLTGEFGDSYMAADNRSLIATDTMKNTVYVLARTHDLASPESFGLDLCEHFLSRYTQISSCRATVQVEPMERIVVDGASHPHAFTGGASGKRVCEVNQSRMSLKISAGIAQIAILKTTDSAFRGFQRDELTTLPEVDDRILATLLDATWTYESSARDWNELYAGVRETLLHSFATHKSTSVQATLYAMGRAVLEAHQAVAEISLAMPNRHNLLVNLQPFGLDNPNCIFMPTSEPFGLITGTLRRN